MNSADYVPVTVVSKPFQTARITTAVFWQCHHWKWHYSETHHQRWWDTHRYLKLAPFVFHLFGNGIDIIPVYFSVFYLDFTAALYITFGHKRLAFSGHLHFVLYLHMGSVGCFWCIVIFCCTFYDFEYFLVQLQLSFSISMLNILYRFWYMGSVCQWEIMNILPIFVYSFLLHVRLVLLLLNIIPPIKFPTTNKNYIN